MAKHVHTIILNRIGKVDANYDYSFGHTEHIGLKISRSGCSISANLNKIYDKEEMLSGGAYLFPDAIKKALLLYLIRYSKSLEIKSITVKIDDEEETVEFDKNLKPPVSSMVNGALKRNIPASFASEHVSDYLLKTPKSKYGKKISALFAYLGSKSKSYETERFIYLWASFNGMYSWLSDCAVVYSNYVGKNPLPEFKQILIIQDYLGVGHCTKNEKDQTPFAREIVSMLKAVDSDISKADIEESDLSRRIESVLTQGETKYNLTAYGYLLTQLSYYFRCKIIHGSKPIFLFSYDDDGELHALKIINALLEEFIEETLPFWFDDDYIEKNIILKAQTIEIKK